MSRSVAARYSSHDELAEVVRAVGVREHLADVLLDPRAGVEPGGQQVGERHREVDRRQRRQRPPDLARHAEQVQRQPQALGDELAVVRPQQHVQRDLAERLRHLVVDHPHHLLGRDAVGGQRRDQRAGAGADVDVELVDGAVDGEQVERAQGADLVHAAREAAAAEHQRGLGGPGPATAPVARILRALRHCPSLLTQCTVTVGQDRRYFRRTRGFPTADGQDRLPRGIACRRPRARRPGRRPSRHRTRARQADEPRRRGVRRVRGRPRQRRDAVRPRRRRARAPRRPSTSSTRRLRRCCAGARRASSPPRSSAPPSSTTTACVKGNVYLRGGGDPEFSSAEARGLARVLAGSGLTKITGRVVGDESRFDGLRGGPDSNYGVSFWVGPLSGLPFNKGLIARLAARASSANPARYAADQFRLELRRAGVKVRRKATRRRRARRRRDARGVGVGADVGAGAPHQPPVGQLHGRDAAQGPRRRLRRRRHDRRRRRRRAPPGGASSARSRRSSTARG